MGEAGDIKSALQQLEQIDPAISKKFQPWWVAKGYLLSLDKSAARETSDAAYQTAIGMTVDHRLKNYLETVRQSL